MRASALSLWLALGIASFDQLPPPPGPGTVPSQPVKGSGLILGRVVDAATGQPISEATVTIVLMGGGRGGGPAAPGPVQMPDSRLVTGADGRFLFRELPKGNYPLSVNASGYVQGSAGQTRPTGPSSPVQLADAQKLTTLTIRLWKYAVVSGMVLDEAGEPAVNMTVRAFAKTTAGGRPRYNAGASTKTDDRGMYRMATLTPGDYVIGVPQTQQTMPAAILDSVMQGLASGGGGSALMDMVSSGAPPPTATGVRIGDLLLSSESGSAPAPAKDGRIYVYQTLFFPGASAIALATPVLVKSGEERTGVDFQLRLMPTLRVAGTVMGPSGPLSGVGVRLSPAVADASAGDAGADVATTATRPDGTFTFLGVPEGQLIAHVLRPPRPNMPAGMANNAFLQMIMGSGGQPSPDADKLLFADVPVTVAGSDVSGLAIALHEGLKVSGRVEFDGAAMKPAGPQLQAISITLTSADGRASIGAGVSGPTRLGADGSFQTSAYPAGKYLIAVAGGGAAWLPKSAMVGGRDVFAQPLELKDADVSDLVITFTDRPSQVSGQVRGEGGPAPAGTQVLLFPQDYRNWIANGMPPRRSRTIRMTSTNGSFSMQGLLAGDYLLAAVEDSTDNQDLAFFDELARLATHVTLGEGETRTQDLRIVTVKR